jgi:hypothetical protein
VVCVETGASPVQSERNYLVGTTASTRTVLS